MNRLLPRSLVGQMAVLIGIALLLAQMVNFAYVLAQRHRFNRAEIDTPAITRFTTTATDFTQAVPEFQMLVLNDASHRGSLYSLGSSTEVANGLERRDDTEERLTQSLSAAGVTITDVRAAIDPHPQQHRSPNDARRPFQSMLLSARLGDGRWINARLTVPQQPPLVTPELVTGTLVLYLFVLVATVLIAQRLARPLSDLTRAAEAFRGRNQPIVVKAAGPGDLRNAILAFNAMNERVAKLIEEKDRTLGAIGHDLRTPLASLRIRAETVEPEEDRDRMIWTIEEMTATLEAILTLARSGRSMEKLERINVTQLVRSIVADYVELGSAVTFAGGDRQPSNVQPNLLRRAVRNLIDNALTYAGGAEVEVHADETRLEISISDRGPGIRPEDLERIRGAFFRGEPSRNRDTGGAGLGLSIAEAAADAHGGTLSLANRDGGGLVASIILPLNG